MSGAILLGYGSIGRRLCRVLDERHRPLAIVNRSESVRRQAAHDFPDARVVARIEELDEAGFPWADATAVIATWGPSHAELFHRLADRGVRRFLCEKPLANSVERAAGMVQRAEREGLVLAAHHNLRYAGLAPALRQLCGVHQLGEPVGVVVQGGAAGLVTNGVHWLDFATELFGTQARRVVSTAYQEPINPRSAELQFEGGTAVWTFQCGREAAISFSNRSSIAVATRVFLRDAVADIAYRGTGPAVHLHVTLRRRPGLPPDHQLPVTRTGAADELLYSGLPPGARRFDDGLRAAVRDASESGGVISPGAAGAAAVSACIGALVAGRDRRSVDLPLDPHSPEGRETWSIS